jgi:hypothetical protein
MAFYTYKNCKITLNEQPIFVTNASVEFAARPEPQYYSEQRHAFDYTPTNAIGGRLDIAYILTGEDPLKGYFEEEKYSITGDFGGLNFKSGYLSSYSFQGVPASPVTVQAQIVFFDDLKGDFNPTYEQAEKTDFLNFSDAVLGGGSGIGDVSNVLNFGYGYQAEIEPVIRAGDIVPSEVRFGKKQVSLSLDIDTLSGDLSITGNNSAIQINLKPVDSFVTIESFGVRGPLHAKNIKAAANEPLMTSLSIRQDNVVAEPTITDFSPLAFREHDLVTINGTNFSTVTKACFGAKCTNEVTIVSDERVIVKVPYGASKNDPYISVTNFGGESRSPSTYTLLFADMLGSYAVPFTGYPGDEIIIHGQNFDRISEVLFPPNDIPTNSFSVVGTVDLLNDGQISATHVSVKVPELACKGKIKIVSEEKDQTVYSDVWLPLPKISGFDPSAGDVDNLVSIEGQSFLGLTGVQFNGLNSTFSIVDSYETQAFVPNNDAQGKIKLMGYTDHIPLYLYTPPGHMISYQSPERRSYEAISQDVFQQDVAITGFMQDVYNFRTWESYDGWPQLKTAVKNVIAGGTETVTIKYSFMSGGSLRRAFDNVIVENVDMEDYVDTSLNAVEFSGEIVSAIEEWKTALEDWFPGLSMNFVDLGTERTTGLATDYYGADYDIPTVSPSGIGDWRFSMSPIDGQHKTLAYAYVPGGSLGSVGNIGGDLVFDSQDDWRMDGDPHSSDPNAYSVKLIAAHEIGHVLGIGHNSNTQSLLYPLYYSTDTFSTKFPDGIKASEEEHEAIKAIYGDIRSYSITTGNAGSDLIIQGKNFWPTRLKVVEAPDASSSFSGSFIATFSDNTTGLFPFTGVDQFSLTGRIPLDAVPGEVYMNGDNSLHPSGEYLYVIPPLGYITHITPGTV